MYKNRGWPGGGCLPTDKQKVAGYDPADFFLPNVSVRSKPEMLEFVFHWMRIHSGTKLFLQYIPQWSEKK